MTQSLLQSKKQSISFDIIAFEIESSFQNSKEIMQYVRIVTDVFNDDGSCI